MIAEKGLDAALVEIGDPQGLIVWKDSYVFCLKVP